MAPITNHARSYEKRSIIRQQSEKIANQLIEQRSMQQKKPSHSVAVCRLTEA